MCPAAAHSTPAVCAWRSMHTVVRVCMGLAQRPGIVIGPGNMGWSRKEHGLLRAQVCFVHMCCGCPPPDPRGGSGAVRLSLFLPTACMASLLSATCWLSKQAPHPCHPAAGGSLRTQAVGLEQNPGAGCGVRSGTLLCVHIHRSPGGAMPHHPASYLLNTSADRHLEAASQPATMALTCPTATNSVGVRASSKAAPAVLRAGMRRCLPVRMQFSRRHRLSAWLWCTHRQVSRSRNCHAGTNIGSWAPPAHDHDDAGPPPHGSAKCGSSHEGGVAGQHPWAR